VDCSGVVSAVLVLQGGYTPGTDLTNGDLVSLTYNGSNLLSPFTIDQSSDGLSISGQIPATLPSAADFAIVDSVTQLRTFSSGFWCAGQACGFDFGGRGLWSNGVPEPDAWAMMIVGTLGLGAMLRTRRRLATAA
jgi:hypothetical protein